MMTYLMHTALLVCAAFLAGLILGKLIKWLFCRGKKNAAIADDAAVYDPLGGAVAGYDQRRARLGMTGEAHDLAEVEARKPRLNLAAGDVDTAQHAVDRLKADPSNASAISDKAALAASAVSSFKASFPPVRQSSDVTVAETGLEVDAATVSGLPGLEAAALDIDEELSVADAGVDSARDPSKIAGLELADFGLEAATATGSTDKEALAVGDLELNDTDFPTMDVLLAQAAAETGVDSATVRAPEIELAETAVTAAGSELPEAADSWVDAAAPAAETETNLHFKYLRGAKTKPNIKLPLANDDGGMVDAPAVDAPAVEAPGERSATAAEMIDERSAIAVEAIGERSAAASAAVDERPAIASAVLDEHLAITEPTVDVGLAAAADATAAALQPVTPVTLDASELAPVLAAAAGVGVTHRLAAESATAEAAAIEQATQQRVNGEDMSEVEVSALLTDIRQQLDAYADGGAKPARTVVLDALCEDCSVLSRLNARETLVLNAGEYAQLASIHCGVTRSGVVAVGGHVSTLTDHQVVLFTLHGVVVCRHEDKHYFVVVAPA